MSVINNPPTLIPTHILNFFMVHFAKVSRDISRYRCCVVWGGGVVNPQVATGRKLFLSSDGLVVSIPACGLAGLGSNLGIFII